jgi:CHAT domain-containing protein
VSRDRPDRPDAEGTDPDRRPRGCPTTEMLSAYVDGRLDPDRRMPIEDHISRCADCYAVVRETMATLRALEDEAPAATPLRRRGSPAYLATAAALILVGGGSWVLWRANRVHDEYAQAIRPLVEAVGPRRYSDARLTGGFEYGPRVRPRRSAGAASTPEERRLVSAANDIVAAARPDDSADLRHARAVAHHLLGEDEEAVRLLEELAKNAGTARVYSDLAAAYLLDGDTDGRDLAKAADASLRAVDKDATLPEALFNRALALERLGLHRQAAESWLAFLRREPRGDWADEARRHLEGLRGQVRADPAAFDEAARRAVDSGEPASIQKAVDANPSWSWDLWEGALLGDWAEAALAGGARRRGLELLAQTTAARCADASLVPLSTPSFAEGARTYTRARRLYDREKWTEASQVLAQMPRDLRDRGLGYWSRLYVGILALQQGRPADAERALDDVITVAEQRGWSMLAGRAHWARAVAAGVQGQLDVTLREYAAAGQLFARVNATEHRAFVSHAEAEALELIGDERRAWESRRAVLRRIDGLRKPRHRFGVYLLAAGSAADMKLEALGGVLLDEAEPDFAAAGMPTDRVQFLLRRAALVRASNPSASAEILERARQTLDLVEDPATRGRFELELVIARALSLEPGERGQAALDHAVEVATTRRADARLPELLFLRATRHAQAGRWAPAEADLDAAFDVYRRATGLSATQRQVYWRQSEIRLPRLLDAALAETHPPLPALLAIERARALWYDEAHVSLAALQRSLASLEATLRSDEAAISFYDGAARRAALVIRPRRSEIVPLPGAPAELDDLRRRAVVAARQPDEPRLHACLDELRRRLIDPLQPHLDGARRLLIAPSADTLGVPFAALWDPTSRQYLVQAAEIEMYPSLWAMGRRAAPRAPAPTRVLFIGGASGNGPSLPDVAAERDGLQATYGDRLSGLERATKVDLAAALARADVVHFSGHVHSGRAFPGLSWIEPAAGGASMVVFAHDVQGLRLRPGAVAVVNGCRSAGDAERDDGGVGFVRPFLLAGASAVLASAWDVFDDKARDSLARVHRHTADGVPWVKALTLVQREMIDRREPTWAWGGYGLFLRSRPDDAGGTPHI